jgi:PhzF family phenazine biosynthesis protein
MSSKPKMTISPINLKFFTLDVFTRTSYEGNPLAVVQIPATLQKFLDQEQKQRIAREFNLSETVFLHEQTHNSRSAEAIHDDLLEWQIEIFTTTEEVPFAGHPTIGSGVLVFSELATTMDRISFRTKAGPMELRRDTQHGDGHQLRVSANVPHNIRVHEKVFSTTSRKILWPEISTQIRVSELRAPFVSIVKGMTFMLIQLDTLEELARVEVSNEDLKLNALLDTDDGWDDGFVGRYYYVLEDQSGAGAETKLRTRMVEKGMEDPATGSAACALASYLSLSTSDRHFQITQGVEMGRRSEIGVSVNLSEDGRNVETVTLRGMAVKVMEGSLALD